MREPDVICDEIEDFIFTQPKGLGYLDLQTYAYDNDKHDWLWLLSCKRKFRKHISFLLRGRRKSGRVSYMHPYEEAERLNECALKKYLERNEIFEYEEYGFINFNRLLK